MKERYLALQDVRVVHDSRNDTVILTSGDPSVRKSGFRLTLRRGSSEDFILRAKLAEAGLYEPRKGGLPAEAELPTVLSGYGEAQLPLGVGADGQEVVWDFASDQHGLLVGRVDDETGSVLNSALGESIRLVRNRRGWMGSTRSGSSDLLWEKYFSEVEDEISGRVEEMKRQNWTSGVTRSKPLTTSYETMNPQPARELHILDLSGGFDANEPFLLSEKLVERLRAVIETAGAVGIHFLLVASQVPAKHQLLMSRLTMRLTVGAVDPNWNSERMFGTSYPVTSPDLGADAGFVRSQDRRFTPVRFYRHSS